MIVADDDPLVRRLVRDVLEDAGVTVIAAAATGREAVELTLHYKPDVVLMDVVMPDIDGITATQRIRARDPDAKIVMLASSDDDDVGMSGLRAGAAGYLCKSMPLEALPRAMRAARDGEAVVSRRLTMRLLDTVRCARADGAGIRPVSSPLTAREWEVLDLMCSGASTEGIAAELFLATETVRSHVKHILRKLGVNSRQAAVEEARRLRAELGLAADEHDAART